MVEVMKKVSRKYEENVKAARKLFPRALVLDVTIEGAMSKLDPSYPVGKVDVPGMRVKGLSVAGVWEALKVFDRKEEIDEAWIADERKLGKKRGCKSWGALKGLQISGEVVSEDEGRRIMREIYEGIVKDRFATILEGIKTAAEKRTVVLLDYEGESAHPFSHAEVLKEIIAA